MVLNAAKPFQKLYCDALTSFYQKFQSIYQVLYTSLSEELEKICRTAEKECSFPIVHLDFTLLRTNIIRNQYIAEVIAYGEGHFFGNESIVLGKVDLSPVYKDYEELYAAVLRESRKYPQTMSAYDAQAFMLSICTDFYQGLTLVLRKHIYELIELPSFQLLPFAEDFEINCGEYAAYAETILIRHGSRNKEKDMKRLRGGQDCNYMDFTKLDICNVKYYSADFRFSDFSFSCLDRCSFLSCYLDFSRLRGIIARDADFSFSVLNGTDFTGADLRGSVFDSIENDLCYESEKPPFIMNYTLSFRDSDLRRGAFYNCNLVNTDFTGANMEDTKFDKISFITAVLSDKQREVIIVMDDETY